MIDQILQGDCREVLKRFDDNYFDAIVCDPPYELKSSKSAKTGFMGKAWDGSGIAYDVAMWAECLRVLKPGGHMLAFGGDRTHHRMFCAIEDAGFDIRRTLVWTFGSGFPKSLNISKKIDQMHPRIGMFDAFAKHFSEQLKATGLSQKEVAKNFPSKTGGLTGCVWNWANGANVPTLAQWIILQPILGLSDDFRPLIERIEAEREVIGKAGYTAPTELYQIGESKEGTRTDIDITAPSTNAAKQWAGWGSDLKPAAEMICLARKPLSESTIAGNVLKHGTGALNIDASRIATSEIAQRVDASRPYDSKGIYSDWPGAKQDYNGNGATSPIGRFPANLIWSHSPNCQRIGTKKVKVNDKEHDRHNDNRDSNCYGKYNPSVTKGFADADGLETVESWDCAPDCPSWEFAKAGESKSKSGGLSGTDPGMWQGKKQAARGGHDDQGSPARFFKSCQFTEEDIPAFIYQAKASRSEREKGLDGMPDVTKRILNSGITSLDHPDTAPGGGDRSCKNNHPTVKPLSLMRYLCRLITPPNGIILDPFAGSGTTLLAAKQEGFHWIGIEKESDYCLIANKRLAAIPTNLTAYCQ